MIGKEGGGRREGREEGGGGRREGEEGGGREKENQSTKKSTFFLSKI